MLANSGVTTLPMNKMVSSTSLITSGFLRKRCGLVGGWTNVEPTHFSKILGIFPKWGNHHLGFSYFNKERVTTLFHWIFHWWDQFSFLTKLYLTPQMPVFSVISVEWRLPIAENTISSDVAHIFPMSFPTPFGKEGWFCSWPLLQSYDTAYALATRSNTINSTNSKSTNSRLVQLSCNLWAALANMEMQLQHTNYFRTVSILLGKLTTTSNFLSFLRV